MFSASNAIVTYYWNQVSQANTVGQGIYSIFANTSKVGENLKVDLYQNSSLKGSNTQFITDSVLSETLRIGGQTSTLVPFDGTMQELIFYNLDQSQNRSTIETDINGFYGAY